MPSSRPAFPIGFLVGVAFIVGGLFHAACPWLLGYQNVTTAAVSNVAAGLSLAAVGLLRLFVSRSFAWVLSAVAAALGFWLLFAPYTLGFATVPLAANEALWGGVFTLLFTMIGLLDRMATRSETA